MEKRGGSIFYLTKEGFKNVWLNRLMSIASVSVLLSCLVLMGMASLFVVNMEKIMANIEDQNVIVAFVDDNATVEETEKVGEDLKRLNNVKDCIFVSKEKAFKEQLDKLGGDQTLFEGMENPLPDSFKVVLSDLEKFNSTLESIKRVDKVQSVRENRELSEQVARIRKAVTYVGIGVIAVLFVVSLFIISNTVKITMFSRRLEIKIMKSVGATPWFIRWPFMVEGMILGIVSGGISLAAVYGVYKLVLKSVGSSFSLLLGNGFVPFSSVVWFLLLAFMVIGIGTGAVGSALSIRKYLKEQEYDSDEE